MDEIAVSSLIVLSGICVYAAVNHLFVALRRPVNLTHLLFAGTCVAATVLALSQIQMYRAQSVTELIVPLKVNVAAATLFLGILLPWSVAAYTKVRPRWLLEGLSLAGVLLLAVNAIQPYSLQFQEIQKLESLRLPWGEVLARPVGPNGPWFFVGVAASLVSAGYALFALTMNYRRDRDATTLAMLLGVVLFVMMSAEGILVRAALIDFIHLGAFGFLVLIIVMSAALNFEVRHRVRTSERRFRALVEQSPFSIQVLSADGRIRQVNAAWEKLWGLKAESLAHYNILRDPQLVDRGVMPYIEKAFAGVASEIPPIVYNPEETPTVRGPIRDRWVRSSIYPIKDAAGGINDVILMHEDVTEKKRIEDAIHLIAAGVSGGTGEQFFRQLVQSLAQLFNADYAFIALLDERDAGSVNTLAVSDHGKIAPNFTYALAGTPCTHVIGRSTCVYPRDVQQLFSKDRMLRYMGVESYVGTPLFDEKGVPLGILVVMHGKPLEGLDRAKAILEIFAARSGAELARLRAETHIRRMAYEDHLTGLASRAHMHERLSEMLDEARQSGKLGALILIDLDHFKTINDALSHSVGDEVLRAVARGLGETVPESALLARPGGDEFGVLIDMDTADTRDAEREARRLAQEIMARLSSPITVGERAFTIGASIGVVMFPDGGESEPDILRRADIALYRAKSLGRGNIQFYLPSLQAAASTRLRLEEGLRQAIAKDELELYFQPLVDAAGRMIGAEALLRWHHADMGEVAPAMFIPIAEETGLIHSIGRWVSNRACSRLKDWLRAGVPFVGHLSINVSPWQFARPDFVEQVREALIAHGIDPGRMMLELTETALLYDVEDTIGKLKALRTLGLRVALDDFGTGYSSLSHLKDLPLDAIKIDQSFVGELDGVKEHPLVETIVAIGRHMRLGVVAEGVESEAQRETLVKLGCEGFQGYLFCRPLPEPAFLKWLSEKRPA
jgi:diguanylate cyclase (GGDEF)-like protein/PAS domain S-box-containing protein